MIIVKCLIDEGLNGDSWVQRKKATCFVGRVIMAVIIVAQIWTARGMIEKNYDLTFAKQIRQFIHAGKAYFTANPNACLDTNIVTVAQRNQQVFTMPYYLSKYNCGWAQGTSKTHPVRNNEGITIFQPGPYPN
jgi:hypothetical protein